MITTVGRIISKARYVLINVDKGARQDLDKLSSERLIVVIENIGSGDRIKVEGVVRYINGVPYIKIHPKFRILKALGWVLVKVYPADDGERLSVFDDVLDLA